MCCGADDDPILGNRERVNAYNFSRLQYVVLESTWARNFSRLEACVEDYDHSIPTPDGIKSLLKAWEKVFNEILQSKSNVELLHHYAQLTKLATGMQMAANTAFGAQYQLYRSDGVALLDAPAGTAEAANAVRDALTETSPLIGVSA